MLEAAASLLNLCCDVMILLVGTKLVRNECSYFFLFEPLFLVTLYSMRITYVQVAI
jgi:hypothetical protein